MERFANKIAVVTGSSSGIGAAIAEELVKHGMNVVGLARRADKLQELAIKLANRKQYSGKLYPLKCDVRNENEIQSSFEYIFDNYGAVSVLVNCAGVLELTLLTDVTSGNIDNTFDTNVKAPLLCSKEVVRNMLSNGIGGHIININSIIGHIIPDVQPGLGTLYSSSKHSLRVISEALRAELYAKKCNIKVTNLSPGLVKTDMIKPLNVIPELVNEAKLEATDVAHACLLVLSNTTTAVISELTLLPIQQ